MKRNQVINLIILGVVILTLLTFFFIDVNRVNNKKAPLFCFSVSVHKDGGTKEYLGVGYKIIIFRTASGYNETKIGTWFMNYNDFKEEIDLYEKEKNDEINQKYNLTNTRK